MFEQIKIFLKRVGIIVIHVLLSTYDMVTDYLVVILYFYEAINLTSSEGARIPEVNFFSLVCTGQFSIIFKKFSFNICYYGKICL